PRRRSAPTRSARHGPRPRPPPRTRPRAPAPRSRAPRSHAHADLNVAEPGRRGAVRHVRVLAGLPLAAVGQAVHPPRLATGDTVEGAPEGRRDARVGGVAQHAAEPAALDLPGDLGPELEVESLVVDRPALVRLEVDALVHVTDQRLDRSLPWLEV